MFGRIYVVTNKINGKQYVGQTRSNDKVGHGKIINEAYNKYGKENFLYETIVNEVPLDKLDELERLYINEYNTLVPNGYNLEAGGNKNKIINKETKRKLSEARKGKTPWNKGKPQSEKQKLEHSVRMKGRQPWNKGKTGIYSEDTISKMAEHAKNRKDLLRDKKGKFIKSKNTLG